MNPRQNLGCQGGTNVFSFPTHQPETPVRQEVQADFPITPFATNPVKTSIFTESTSAVTISRAHVRVQGAKTRNLFLQLQN